MVEGMRHSEEPGTVGSMTDDIVLTIPTSPRLRSVATLVLGGVGSRLRLSYEKVDDLQLADEDPGAVRLKVRPESGARGVHKHPRRILRKS